jgi:hypothetical protein
VTGRRPNDAWGFYKRYRIRTIARQYGCATLVETGTHVGETVEAARHWFRKVLSIELFRELYEANRNRFASAKNVRLYSGDSGELMPEMIREIEGRALFWLDGHYSGPGTAKGDKECPIAGELAAIRGSGRKDDCILIDDARHFGVGPDYPTVDSVYAMLREINPGYEPYIEHDCIHALPPIEVHS